MARRAKKAAEAKVHKYLNPWYRPIDLESSQIITTTVQPVEYRGFQIFHRFNGSHELVKDSVCLTMRAGRLGPQALADALCGDKNDEPLWLVYRARAIAAAHGVTLPIAMEAA